VSAKSLSQNLFAIRRLGGSCHRIPTLKALFERSSRIYSEEDLGKYDALYKTLKNLEYSLVDIDIGVGSIILISVNQKSLYVTFIKSHQRYSDSSIAARLSELESI
jgi:hypothetical protein